MKKGIIDRFEGDLAVVEFNDTMKDIPKAKLPKEADIGDVLIFDDDKITIDTKKKAKLNQEIQDLMDELFDN
ncbi:DUF3006 domain-containing protein [Peribacillus asahii]|uniref:DUF3006 domain-containing protein n=1 Tax=Peribacillus asahii TaxID=228899 RepID=UPI00207AD017|nr:DUF3006 domain-containing protein [Peribacillus asahii]USK60299.1 DUF3006 domain-containing protein [Peribacillus asahii]